MSRRRLSDANFGKESNVITQGGVVLWSVHAVLPGIACIHPQLKLNLPRRCSLAETPTRYREELYVAQSSPGDTQHHRDCCTRSRPLPGTRRRWICSLWFVTVFFPELFNLATFLPLFTYAPLDQRDGKCRPRNLVLYMHV